MPRAARPRKLISQDEACAIMGFLVPTNPGKWAVFEQRKKLNALGLTKYYIGRKIMRFEDEVLAARREQDRKNGIAVAA